MMAIREILRRFGHATDVGLFLGTVSDSDKKRLGRWVWHGDEELPNAG